MADLMDVMNALGAIIGTVLYPAGASGEASSPVAGVPVRVEVGWPSPQSLDIALAAGKTHVSIYPRPEERNTARYPKEWIAGPKSLKTFTLAQAGQVVTLGGNQPSPFYPHNFAVFVNGTPFTYQALSDDTAASIAAALGALIVAAVPGTTVSGVAITMPSSARIGPLRVGTQATATREVGRQQRRLQISVWAPTPAARDAVTQPVDLALRDTPRFTLVDSESVRLLYNSSVLNDFDQKQAIFRRDLFYTVEYGTMQSAIAPEAIVFEADFYQEAPDGSQIEPAIRIVQA